MTQEDYVSFETAKLLKEKGFYQDYFSDITPVWALNGKKPELAFNGDAGFPFQWEEWYSAPTLAAAMKWLRELHSLAIVSSPQWAEGDMRNPCKWRFEIFGLNDTTSDAHNNALFDTYEEACEAAIKYCLENSI